VSEASEFGELVGQLDYPMVIVTAAADGRRAGCLVGFHCQCGIDPPRYLVCISRLNHTASVTRRAQRCAVHFLAASDHPLARLFGERTGDELDKFAACDWRERHGAPVLTGVRAWFVGRVLRRLSLGDHVGHLLEPVAAEANGRLHQLGFQEVKALDPGHPA
jgi:flavin reductase (DIM6/NTAB) family NADH-FMN oxidoreductase RutF